MDRRDGRESDLCTFKCKKWTLFSFCLIGIITTLIAVIALCAVISVLENHDPGHISDVDFRNGKRVAIAVIATIGTISIMFELLGLLGAYKEHHCLTMTYAVLMLLATCASIGSAALEPAYWFTVTIDAVITTLAFLYARDLRRRQLRLAFIRSTGGEDPEFYPTIPVYPPPSYGATPAAPGPSYPMQTHVVADPPAYKD